MASVMASVTTKNIFMLTKLKIDNLKPQAKARKYSDSEGLYLQVNPSGTKCWRYQYRYLGKLKVLSFGTYPYISLSEARDKRIAAKKLLIEGIDPSTAKKDDKRLKRFNNNNTFEAVAKEWFELNKHKWTVRHQNKVYNRLNNYAIFSFFCMGYCNCANIYLILFMKGCYYNFVSFIFKF
jgi:hypothetical protein